VYFRSDWIEFESEVEELAKRLVSNNKKSGNFGSLIDVFCSRQSELVQSVESDRLIHIFSFSLPVGIRIEKTRQKVDPLDQINVIHDVQNVRYLGHYCTLTATLSF
jgi:hypothetical protein